MKEQQSVVPCEKCGHNRWKTKIKNKQWQCYKCNYIRNKIIKNELINN